MRRLPRYRRPDAAGFTLIEAMVSLAIFSIIAVVISTFLIDSTRVNYSLEAQSDTGVMGQQGLDSIRWSLEQSRRLLDVDSGYLPLMDLDGAPAPGGEIRLPRIVPNASISPRGTREQPFARDAVGNALLFVEALPPWREPQTGHLIDRSRFVLYYVARKEGQSFAHMPFCLDLIRWESGVYADFQQIESLGDEMAARVVGGLAKEGINFAFDTGAPPEAAFSRLEGGRLVRPPEPRHRVKAANVASALPGIGRSQRASGVIGYTVAPNDGEVPIATRVPGLAKAADGFPHGFEVVVTGPGHGRKVMLRLVLAAEAHGRYYSREHQAIASVWD